MVGPTINSTETKPGGEMRRLTLVRLSVDLYVDLDINAHVVRLVVLDYEHVHSVRADRSLNIHRRLQTYQS